MLRSCTIAVAAACMKDQLIALHGNVHINRYRKDLIMERKYASGARTHGAVSTRADLAVSTTCSIISITR